MAFCNKCGTQLPDGANNCPNCGAPTGAADNAGQQAQDFINNITNTDDFTAEYDPQDMEQNKIMAVFAYIGILFIIPLLAAPNSKYARFHTNQGLVLFIAEAIIGVASGIICAVLGFIPFAGAIIGGIISSAVSLASLAMMIIGIVNAATCKAKQLPIIGKFTLLK